MLGLTEKEKFKIILDEVTVLKDTDDQSIDTTKISCNAIRNKIRNFLRLGVMTLTDFLKFNKVNSNSYGRFMSYKQPHQGSENNLYWAAMQFFRLKTKAEKNMKIKKKKKEEDKDLL